MLDSLTHEEPYATIKIVEKENPGRALKMMVTDAKGRFQESDRHEKLRAHHNLCGACAYRERNFTVEASKQVVDFGTLYAVDATNELAQVEIVAQKPLVKADVDKIEYNIQDDPNSEIELLLEMLRKRYL